MKIDESLIQSCGLDKDEVDDHTLTLLQKTAKSTCIVKNTFILDHVMNARKKIAQNMYIGKCKATACFYYHQESKSAKVSPLD